MRRAVSLHGSGPVFDPAIDTTASIIAPHLLLGAGTAADPIESCNETHAGCEILRSMGKMI